MPTGPGFFTQLQQALTGRRRAGSPHSWEPSRLPRAGDRTTRQAAGRSCGCFANIFSPISEKNLPAICSAVAFAGQEDSGQPHPGLVASGQAGQARRAPRARPGSGLATLSEAERSRAARRKAPLVEKATFHLVRVGAR